MSTPRSILVVEDDLFFGPMLTELLSFEKYHAVWQNDSRKAVEQAANGDFSLILLDVGMPNLNGFQVCKLLKADPRTRGIPTLMVTAYSDTQHIVEGFASGADDYVGKPLRSEELFARIRTHLSMRDYRDALASANTELATVNQQLVQMNRHLDQLVTEKVNELERTNRLRRYFSPQVVDTIVADNAERLLADHRREITVAFFDLRGFTPFVEANEPAVVMSLLREYHSTVGPIIFEHHGTLERFMGDGFMVYFGDPEAMPDHAVRAVNVAQAIQRCFAELVERWTSRGITLGLGAGIASGEAYLGNIGFAGRLDYSAIGVVTNTAARLCDQARPGQTLINQATARLIEAHCPIHPAGDRQLKGFSAPIPVYSL
ncbi:MAG: response regulator [Verrucomicrobiota bacterium]|nr:response regulator [Verrucomicrobiota bacterium]